MSLHVLDIDEENNNVSTTYQIDQGSDIQRPSISVPPRYPSMYLETSFRQKTVQSFYQDIYAPGQPLSTTARGQGV